MFPAIAGAQSLSVNSGWQTVLDATLISQAGRDYDEDLFSQSNQTLLDLKDLNNGTYTVSVHKIDIDWDPNLELSVQRTGTGTGNPNIIPTGGLTFLPIGNSPQPFLFVSVGGGKNYNNIPLQYRLKGMSVTMEVKNHTTTVVYTITN
ncbi:hypothetical protein AFM12_15110 [Jiulongibacter sediminis]|uniref:Uncharacterized protein n=2 Tax=Jiulongibacter sediminis TaxID=1605367 RepID=A0A0P7BJ16_9BACT|nr:hypothetical protein AFM12_15110 [Jiulongibacter sediminis]TBX22705.1 hypothetical protein TK44_15120 [Jiulongibacter sediminis]